MSNGQIQPADQTAVETATTPDRMKARLAEWASARGCRLLVHFGSSASGDSASARDVDLALDLPELPDPRRRLRIIGELQDICPNRPVDVVFLGLETDPVLRFEIFRTGRPIHESCPGLFVEETVRAIALYEDALPFRRALRKRLMSP
jgi:predicted nucleotidyltransferase